MELKKRPIYQFVLAGMPEEEALRFMALEQMVPCSKKRVSKTKERRWRAWAARAAKVIDKEEVTAASVLRGWWQDVDDWHFRGKG